MEEALVGHLLAFAGLTALVGNRIDWGVRPQGKDLPAVVLTTIDALPDYATDGPTGLVQSRIQVDCWGGTYLASKQTARQVNECLSGMAIEVGGTIFRGSFASGERDFFERGAGSEDLFRTSLDFIIWHGEGD